MPTLLQINSVVNYGSTGRIAEEIGQVALASGWRSVIAYGRGPARQSRSELIRIGTNRDVCLHVLRSRIFDDHGFASAHATREFLEKLDALRPDVVHLHNLHGYFINIELLFRHLAKTDVPVVWTLHDCWAFTGHCAYFSFSGCGRWKSGCFSCPQKRSYPASFVFDRSRKNWEQKRALFSSLKNLTLVPVSDWLAGLARESFLGGKKIHRIYNGVDCDTFCPQDGSGDSAESIAKIRQKYGLGDSRNWAGTRLGGGNGSGEGKFVVLGCANIWSSRKGFQDFLRLRERLSAENFALVMVGLSEEQLRELPREIIGIKRTASVAELTALYATADLFFNPTYEDNFPMVNIEALACGTPVCTYRTGGSPEAVTGETGFVVEQGDLDGVVSAIETMRSRGGKAAYAAACRSRALACFKKEDRWAEYLTLPPP